MDWEPSICWYILYSEKTTICTNKDFLFSAILPYIKKAWNLVATQCCFKSNLKQWKRYCDYSQIHVRVETRIQFEGRTLQVSKQLFRISESLKIGGLDSIYYQVFPCLRIVQPGDFSIGPHADVAWRFQGRSRCSGYTENPQSSFKGIISKCFFHSYATQAWRPS